METRSMTRKKKSAEAKTNNQTWSNLPNDLKLLILQRLSLKNNIRASTVCKTWHKALVSVRVEDSTPWVMFTPIFKDEYELYDTSLGKTHTIKFPKLRGSEVCYSRESWLLMRGKDHTTNFFFNPFTRELIDVAWPDLWLSDAIAFSCAPTSSSCVLLSVCDIDKTFIGIETYRPTTKKRSTLVIPHHLPVAHKGFQHVVFSNGVFFCLTKIGCLGMFNLSTKSWNVILQPPPKRLETRNDLCFMTEYQGDIYVVYTHGLEPKPTYLKLDLTKQEWMENKRLRGLTFYFGLQTAVTTNRDIVGTLKLRECVWFNVWIKPPINASRLFES